MKIKGINILSNFHYVVYFLLLFPLVFNIGNNIFSNLGKFYYLILLIITYINFILLYLKKQLSYCFYRKKTYSKVRKILKWFVLFLVLLIISVTFIYLFYNLNTNDYALFVLLIMFFVYFFSVKSSNKDFRKYGLISTVSLFLFFIQNLFLGKFTYFNPNTYAFISNVLFFASSIFILTLQKYKIPLYSVSLTISIYLSFIVYKSETQLFSCLLYLFFILFRKDLFGNKINFITITTFIFLFTIGLPFLSSYLIELGIVDFSFITGRGERWYNTIEMIKNSGFFQVNKIIDSHNGFLDTAIKYSTFIAIILFALLYIVLLSFYKLVKADLISKIIYINIIVLLFMNSVESLLFNLTNAYFLFINIGFLLSRKIQCFYIKNNQMGRGDYK